VMEQMKVEQEANQKFDEAVKLDEHKKWLLFVRNKLTVPVVR
jgi:uncharacterized protein YneR